MLRLYLRKKKRKRNFGHRRRRRLNNLNYVHKSNERLLTPTIQFIEADIEALNQLKWKNKNK